MVNKRPKMVVTGLTKGILIALGAGTVIGVALMFPHIGWLYKEFKREQWKEARRRGILKATIKRLERQELVSWKEENGELRLTLTDKGKKRILQYNIDTLKIDEKQKWDGLWRVIIFDIPESKKVAREIFREKLKKLGFQRLQKSVFVSRFECKNEIDFLRYAFEIAPYVQYILAKEISGLRWS